MSIDFDEKVKNSSFRLFLKGMKVLYQLLHKYRGRLYLLCGMMFVVTGLQILFPYLLKMIFDELPGSIANNQVSTKIVYLIGSLFVVKIANDLLWHFVHRVNYLKLTIDIENDLPCLAQKKLLELTLEFHEKENVGKKVSKIEKGIDRTLQIIHMLFWGFFPPAIFMMINVTVLMIIDWRIGAVMMCSFVPGIFIYKYTYDRHIGEWDIWEEKKEKAVGLFCQSLINVNTVQNFVQEKREISEHQKLRNEMRDLDKNLSSKIERIFSLISLTFNFGFMMTISLGIYLVFSGEASIGTLVFLIATGNFMLGQVWELMNSYTTTIRRIYAVLRMKELLDEEPDIVNSENAFVPSSYNGKFEIKNVEFCYSGKDHPVLENFSIDLNPSKMIALVGRSGEGKTTVTRLLCRMYDLEKGGIYLDEVNIKELDIDWYKRLFAIVRQDIEIFDGPMILNLCYAYPDATPEQIDQSVRSAYLKDLVEDTQRFPDGLLTQVGERGVKLSGGERQRVGIARAYLALLNGARVLVLDEATSSLDSEAEKAIQEMINGVRKKLNISIVAIAHRLSTIQRADMIYVIDDGGIVEQGDHKRLSKKNGLYSRLVELQQLGDLRE